MGVQHLWSILEQSKTEENIENLRDKTLCIDLSLWICEAQGTKGLRDQLKPYLRNVFFRTLYLASLGVRPVFVVDGVPPEIKRETIIKRLEARGEHVGYNSQKQRKLNRSKFTMRCNECCEMLGLLGVPFIKSDGEAEAMCAWLNENNYADGVLTDDGDVFLYGAKVVYKDFNISASKQPTNNLQVYRLDKIESGLGLTRRNMIALALLLGCDYLPAGVPGVGKETAVKLLTSLPGVDLLERFHAWKSFPDVHPHDITSLEVAIKRKAIKVPDFPNKAVIKEFLSPKVGNAYVHIKWKRPDLEMIKEFFLRKLDWPKEYTEEKMLILVTDWQLAHINLTRAPSFCPTRIVKPRIKQGKEYYEIEWNAENETAKLWPNTFISVKPKEIICKQFPALVAKFESELAAKKSKGNTKKGKKNKMASDEPECFEDLLCKISGIDLNDDSRMKEHSEDNCGDCDGPSKKTLQDDTASAEKPRFKPHQDSKNDTDAMTSYNHSEGETSCSGGRVENLDLSETKNSVNFDWIKPSKQKSIVVGEVHKEQILATRRCEIIGKSSIFLNRNSPNSCNVFESVGTFNTPSESEKTSLNLADITVDQTFGSDLEAIDDLLTDSFVASLQNLTPVHGSTNCYNTELSPSPDLFSGSNTKDGSTLFQSNAVQSKNVIPFKDESLTNAPEGLSMKSLPESLSTKVELDRENDDCDLKIKANCSLLSPGTPLSREATSLTSRLLKRFQTENRSNMINMLRSISGEEEHVNSDDVVSKSTVPLMHHGKQNRTFSTENQVKNEPLTSISNTGKELKSSKIKPSDVVTVLD